MGPNTDRIPTPNLFQVVIPMGDNYAEVLRKVREFLSTLGGELRATAEGIRGQGRETEK